MAGHPNVVVEAMKAVGYSLSDMLAAYPGRDETYLDQVLRDNALALSRPVISYGLLGIHSCRTTYFNISEQGFRQTHPAQRWPPGPGKKSVFVFGGSTALGFNVEDSQTIPACLQRQLESAGVACEVYNFGSGNYTSRHEALRFLSLADQGVVPDYAVFLDGYNDCCYAFGNGELIRVLDELYQREKTRQRSSRAWRVIDAVRLSIGSWKLRLPTGAGYVPEIGDSALESAIVECVSESAILEALQSSDRVLGPGDMTAVHAQMSCLVWNRYLDSVAIIRSVAARKGVRTLFAWQPVPLFRTTTSQRVMERLYLVFRYGVFTRLIYNWLYRANYPSMGDAPEFMDLSALGESVDEVLYLDMVHYSAAFSARIARAISDKLALELQQNVQ